MKCFYCDSEYHLKHGCEQYKRWKERFEVHKFRMKEIQRRGTNNGGGTESFRQKEKGKESVKAESLLEPSVESEDEEIC